MAGTSDHELILRFQKGSPEAFPELYHRHAPRILDFFHYLTFNRALSEDLLQETFLKLWRGLHRFEPRAPFRHFLYRLARNVWIDHGRLRKNAERPVQQDLLDARPEESRGPAETAVLRETRSRVRRAIDALPSPVRETLILSKFQGLKNREIAVILEIPEGTVESRLSKAYHDLRPLLHSPEPVKKGP